MTTAQESAGRFALDESKAREWLARAVDQAENGGTDETVPAIEADWSPRDKWDPHSGDIYLVVQLAQDAGVVTAPEGCKLIWQDASDENEIGYRWEAWLPSMQLAGHYEKGWHLGEQGPSGADAALAILREGIYTANSLLGDLDRYVASLPLSVRAPEAGELLAKLPRGEWGSDELATLANWLTEHGFDIGGD